MKVFALQTYEPKEVFMLRVKDGSFFDVAEIGLYADRETAELVARNYNEEFGDPTPAKVVELEVQESSTISQQKQAQQVYAVHIDFRPGAYDCAILLFKTREVADAFASEYVEEHPDGFAEVLELGIEESFETGAARHVCRIRLAV